MKHDELVKKIAEMRHSEFLRPNEQKFIDKETEKFIKKINEFFGDNDGEPLDETGIKFVMDYLKLQMKLSLGVVDD